MPKLIPVLTASEVQVVWVPTQGGGQGMSFGTGTGAGFGVANRSIPIMTGPVVGNGAVAFGATSVPSSAFNGSGVSLNGGNQGATPKYVEVVHRNTEVLAALVKLTGQDYGYEIDIWKNWLNTSYPGRDQALEASAPAVGWAPLTHPSVPPRCVRATRRGLQTTPSALSAFLRRRAIAASRWRR